MNVFKYVFHGKDINFHRNTSQSFTEKMQLQSPTANAKLVKVTEGIIFEVSKFDFSRGRAFNFYFGFFIFYE